MPWFWTDDLADMLVEHAGLSPESYAEWIERPTAYSAPDSTDPLEFARSLAGIENEAVA